MARIYRYEQVLTLYCLRFTFFICTNKKSPFRKFEYVFPHAENTSFIKEKTYTSKLPKGGFSNSLSNYFQIKLLR